MQPKTTTRSLMPPSYLLRLFEQNQAATKASRKRDGKQHAKLQERKPENTHNAPLIAFGGKKVHEQIAFLKVGTKRSLLKALGADPKVQCADELIALSSDEENLETTELVSTNASSRFLRGKQSFDSLGKRTSSFNVSETTTGPQELKGGRLKGGRLIGRDALGKKAFSEPQVRRNNQIFREPSRGYSEGSIPDTDSIQASIAPDCQQEEGFRRYPSLGSQGEDSGRRASSILQGGGSRSSSDNSIVEVLKPVGCSITSPEMTEYIRQRYWGGYKQTAEERINPEGAVSRLPLGKRRIPNSREYPDTTMTNLVHTPENFSSAPEEKEFMAWCRSHWPAPKEQEQIAARLIKQKALARVPEGVGQKMREDICLQFLNGFVEKVLVNSIPLKAGPQEQGLPRAKCLPVVLTSLRSGGKIMIRWFKEFAVQQGGAGKSDLERRALEAKEELSKRRQEHRLSVLNWMVDGDSEFRVWSLEELKQMQ